MYFRIVINVVFQGSARYGDFIVLVSANSEGCSNLLMIELACSVVSGYSVVSGCVEFCLKSRCFLF